MLERRERVYSAEQCNREEKCDEAFLVNNERSLETEVPLSLATGDATLSTDKRRSDRRGIMRNYVMPVVQK